MDAEAKVDLLLKVLEDKSLKEEDKSQLKAALKNASTSTFQLGGDAKEVTIKHRTLDSFITGARIKEDLGNTFRKRLKGNDLYIVTSVLMSNSFSLTSSNQSEQSLKASFTELKDTVEASTKLKVKKQDDASIQFEGDEPIVFAFKAVQLKFDRNEVNEPDFLIQDKTGIVVKSADKLSLNYLELEFGEELDI